VKVLPYVGQDYGREKPWGVSVLILGESHYHPERLNPEFTCEVVQAVIDGANYPFFTKVVGSFYGAWPDHDLRRQFWKSVAFYNFIQETVGAKPRIRPTDQMWRNAGPPLEEVLIQHEPGFVLVLGKQLWENLPIPLKRGPLVTLGDGQSRESRLYFNDAGYAFTFGINHPSSGGWTYEKWTPWVQAAVQAAVRFQGEGRPWTRPSVPPSTA
jgi:hypothetical protein